MPNGWHLPLGNRGGRGRIRFGEKEQNGEMSAQPEPSQKTN